MVGFATGLAPLSARPPTPPKESALKLPNGNESLLDPTPANHPPLDTPDESPSSSAGYFNGSLERTQKKVGFSPWTEFHRLPFSGEKDSDSEGQIRRLPPSKDCKSLKSILKACTDSATDSPDNELVVFDQTSLPAMLRSTTQHLLSTLRSSRLDAYATLLACLSAYDDIPDTQELSEKVVEITGHIRRDVCAKMEQDGSLDTQLATQALKVLTVFLCTPSMAMHLPEDFCSLILDRSISVIEDAGSPKILVSHYMHLLEKQKFTSRNITTDRVNRLLSALDAVNNRVKGNRVICHRLMIYQRLLTQAKPVMASRVSSWIDHLISGMLSTIKDVRLRAIGFGVEAGLQLGTISSVSQACIEVFNRASPEGKKVVDFLSSRLTEMLRLKEDGVHVPQIWSIVILFFRSRRHQLECWEHLKAWLVVIQRCLNSNEPQVKFHANIAWSRLIFAINLDTSTSNSMAKMLRQPMVSQLERKATDKNSRQAKQIARSTYCTLVYYAFRPGATHAQLDQYWDLYVSQILPSTFAANKSDANHACEILTALLSGNGKAKVWDENRSNLNGPVKADELPCLDPKWIRLRAANIIQIFDRLFEMADWRMDEDHEAPIILAWRSFMTALGVASSKEVKVSMDLMNAVSHIINQIKRLLERSVKSQYQWESSNQGDRSDDFERIRCLLHEAVAKIGHIPFTERRMVLTSQNSFEAAETPSSRSGRDSSSLNSPAAHLLNLFLTNLRDKQPTASYNNAVKAVMQISLQIATTRRTQLGALRNLAHFLSADGALDRGASLVFWKLLAEATSLAIKLPQQNVPHNASPQYPGHEYREAVKILEFGVQQRSVETIPAWHELYECIAGSLREEIGDEGVILILSEPLAGIVHKFSDTCDVALLYAATMVLENTRWPQTHHSMDRAQKLLWGVVHASSKASSVNPYDNIYSMVDKLLSGAYICLGLLSTESITSFLSAVTTLLASCPPAYQESILNRTQKGLAPWMEDANEMLSASISSRFRDITSKVNKLWAAVVMAIERVPDPNTRFLFGTQSLILSGLRSRHQAILNQTIVMWNHTFGCAESLEYPKELRKILLKLQPLTDIHLPTFPDAEADEAMSSPLRIIESQDDESDVAQPSTASRTMKSPRRLIPKAPHALTLSPSPKVGTNSPLSLRRGVKTTPNARLRHNDSQIQFAAIESSPLASDHADSQSLTDRQREVKERQGLEAAMFPEIRSSPKSASRPTDYTLPKLVFQPIQIPNSKPAVDEETSPIYPPDVLMNDFLGSSPTPTSTKKGVNDMHSDDGPPSSPPLVPSHLKINQQVTPAFGFEGQVQSAIEGPGPNRADTTDKNLASTDTLNKASDLNVAVLEAASSANNSEDISGRRTSRNLPEDRILSDSDVFVDAPSEPVEKLPVTRQNDNMSVVFNSFQSENSAHFPTEEEQVTAQLVSEMERASSQQSGRRDGAQIPTPKASGKRKASLSDTVSPQKKAKKTPTSLGPREAAKTRKTGEVVAEYVMIDARPIEGGNSASALEIKKEPSEPPSLIRSTQPADESAVFRRKSGRTSGKSRTKQMSQESSSSRSSPRQSQVKSDPDVIEAPTRSIARKNTRSSTRLSEEFASGPQSSAASSLEAMGAKPASLTKTGKVRAGMRWSYVEEPAVPDTQVMSANKENTEMAIEHEKSSGRQESEHTRQVLGQPLGQPPLPSENEAPTTSPGNEASQPESAGNTEMSGNPPTAEGILQGFRNVLSSMKRVGLGPEEERAISTILFESMRELHEAGRRHTGM